MQNDCVTRPQQIEVFERAYYRVHHLCHHTGGHEEMFLIEHFSCSVIQNY